MIPFPSNEVSPDEATRELRQLGREHSRKYEEALDELRRRSLEVDPLSLLSQLAFYGLPTRDGKDPELTQQNPLLQHHVELLQALTLQRPRSSYSAKRLSQQEYTRFHELLIEVTEGFRLRDYGSFDASSPDQQRRLRVFSEDVRRHTQLVRNWGYPQQVTRIVSDLFAPLDDMIEQRTGVRVAHLVAMCNSIKASAEARSKSHHAIMYDVLKTKNLRTAVHKFCASFPEHAPAHDELAKLAVSTTGNAPEVRQLLIELSGESLPAVFSFTVAEFIAAYPGEVEADALKRVLRGWAISFDDLRDSRTEHLFLNNPVWSRPLVALGEDRYFVPVVGMFTSFLLEMVERVIEGNAHLQAKYEKRRATFLEDEVARLFREAFPTARLCRGSMWHDPVENKVYENDLLVQIDTHLIIVEAKSGKVADSAWRGSVQRLKKAVKELIVAPSEQAARFAAHLKANAGIHRLPTKSGDINEVDATKVSKVVRLNVTLEWLGIVSARHPTLREAGLLAHGVETAVTMSIAELENVFELLERPSEKLHYLARRTELEANATYFGDERDLLAFYISTGFCIGESEFDTGKMMVLYGDSKTLDGYFMRQWHKRHAPKPERRLTRWWRDVLAWVERSQSPHWTELGQILLDVAHDEQTDFERKFKLVQSNVRRSRSGAHHECLVTMLIGHRKRDAIVGLAFRNLSREGRENLAKRAAGSASEAKSIERVLVVCRDVESPDYPYSAVFYTGSNIRNEDAEVKTAR